MAPNSWAGLFLDEDPRGNRLQNAYVSRSADGRDYFLELLCCDDIAQQFFTVLAAKGRNPTWQPFDRTHWSHKIRFDGPYDLWLETLITLLERVLTLRTYDEIDLAIALDFYKVPPAADDPDGKWGWTETGSLVYRKHFKEGPRSPAEVTRAGSQLTDLLVEVIREHPIYSTATTVIVVPSTKNPWKFGERLGNAVSQRAGLGRAQAVCLSSDHKQAKEGHASEAVEPWRIDGDVSGQRVIVVDDLYKSGQTIRDIAIAARQAGAVGVLGLAGGRTHTKR